MHIRLTKENAKLIEAAMKVSLRTAVAEVNFAIKQLYAKKKK